MGWLVVDESAKDICYRNLMGDGDWAPKARAYLEDLYSLTSDVLDRKFQQQAKDHLHGCFAEMYFAAVCRKRLSLSISHPSDKGLDFYLDDFNCWVECVAPTDGYPNSEDTIPSFDDGISYDFPERQFLLRLSSVFSTKSKKVIADKSDGLVLENQPVVIFISVADLRDKFCVYLHPPIFHVLLGLGVMNFIFDEKSEKLLRTTYEQKKFIERSGDKPDIEIGYFFDPNYSHISAVVYSLADFSNLRAQSEWGSDFYVLHNPLAKNKLPYGSISCGKEFYVDMNSEPYAIVKYKSHDPD